MRCSPPDVLRCAAVVLVRRHTKFVLLRPYALTTCPYSNGRYAWTSTGYFARCDKKQFENMPPFLMNIFFAPSCRERHCVPARIVLFHNLPCLVTSLLAMVPTRPSAIPKSRSKSLTCRAQYSKPGSKSGSVKASTSMSFHAVTASRDMWTAHAWDSIPASRLSELMAA